MELPTKSKFLPIGTKKYGKPDSTFISGHSMGGGITVASIEKFLKDTKVHFKAF